MTTKINTENNFIFPIQKKECTTFNTLIDLANSPLSNFSIVFEKFNRLKEHCPDQYPYDYDIEDEKGAAFSKVVEIKAQKAHLFVEEIKECKYEEKKTDGFTRRITINVPGFPEFVERLYIDKNPNGEIKVIFIQNDADDHFACINHVYQKDGQWHWSGCYLYGSEEESSEIVKEKRTKMFQTTYANMLNFMDSPNLILPINN